MQQRVWMNQQAGSVQTGTRTTDVIRWKGGYWDTNDERLIAALRNTRPELIKLVEPVPGAVDSVDLELASGGMNLNGVDVKRCAKCYQLVPAAQWQPHLEQHGREPKPVENLIPHLPAEALGFVRQVSQAPAAPQPAAPKRARKKAVPVS